MNQTEAKNKLVQEWLWDISMNNRFKDSSFGFGLGVLMLCIFTNLFPKWYLLVLYVLYPFFYLWIYGMVLKYKIHFSYYRQLFVLDSLFHKLSTGNIRYEKVIYVSKSRRGEDYWLTLEIWFDRQPFAFMEQLKTVEGRTEQKYYGKGIRATYWSSNPGQIDVIADFIDEYNKQKDANPTDDQSS